MNSLIFQFQLNEFLNYCNYKLNAFNNKIKLGINIGA